AVVESDHPVGARDQRIKVVQVVGAVDERQLIREVIGAKRAYAHIRVIVPAVAVFDAARTHAAAVRNSFQDFEVVKNNVWFHPCSILPLGLKSSKVMRAGGCVCSKTTIRSPLRPMTIPIEP